MPGLEVAAFPLCPQVHGVGSVHPGVSLRASISVQDPPSSSSQRHLRYRHIGVGLPHVNLGEGGVFRPEPRESGRPALPDAENLAESLTRAGGSHPQDRLAGLLAHTLPGLKRPLGFFQTFPSCLQPSLSSWGKQLPLPQTACSVFTSTPVHTPQALLRPHWPGLGAGKAGKLGFDALPSSDGRRGVRD